jgi:hypothetical protein
MQAITTIGFDIAKSVFQVHGVDAAGQVIVRRQLKRRQVIAFFQKLPPCLVGIEACASSHYWSRELHALGHRVRLMPPAYVKPYVKRKNDMADAEAICEAVTRANMRFVPTKTPEQQSGLVLHRMRHQHDRDSHYAISPAPAPLRDGGASDLGEGSDRDERRGNSPLGSRVPIDRAALQAVNRITLAGAPPRASIAKPGPSMARHEGTPRAPKSGQIQNRQGSVRATPFGGRSLT